MRVLSDTDILDVWERGQLWHPVDRALVLLSAAYPKETTEDLARLPVGQRDVRLLAVRERTVGSKLDGYVQCPQCREPLEFTINVVDLTAADKGEPAQREQKLVTDDFELDFRLPNSMDLAAIANCDRVDHGRMTLVKRCVLQARHDAAAVAVADLPESVIEALAAAMEELDPLANVQLEFSCPACSARWLNTFDIVSYLWTEVSIRAKRLLSDVHALALAYGWSEMEILSMSPARRQYYLEIIS
jgi:hypothetical protein